MLVLDRLFAYAQENPGALMAVGGAAAAIAIFGAFLWLLRDYIAWLKKEEDENDRCGNDKGSDSIDPE